MNTPVVQITSKQRDKREKNRLQKKCDLLPPLPIFIIDKYRTSVV